MASFKQTLQLTKQMVEVKKGKRGFVSLANQGEDVKSIAKSMGLVLKNHGKYGCCASID